MKRIQVTVPEDIVEEMDKFVKPRGRSRFITDALRRQLDQLRFKKAVTKSLRYPGWKEDAHPELKEGAAAYITRIRATDQVRVKR